MRAVHPGEILREDFLAPLGTSAITPDTAERLVRYFGGDAGSLLALQATYDLETLPTRGDALAVTRSFCRPKAFSKKDKKMRRSCTKG